MIRYFSLVWVILLSTSSAFAVEYYCTAVKKVGFGMDYSQEQLDKGQFGTRVEEEGDVAYLSRCSFSPSAGEITCDRYQVDRIERDGIKKYYHFRSQFNFQIFQNLKSIEDDGRGGIQFGKCEIVAP